MKINKIEAIKLRKNGESYKEISKSLNVSLSTLSGWFKNKEWSKEIKRINTKKNIKKSTDNIIKINIIRKKYLENKYEEIDKEAEKEFEIYKNDPLFMAGLMVYAGEGDKVSKNLTRLSNSEFYLHLVFIGFLNKYLPIDKNKIKFWLLLYPDHDIEKCIHIWSKKLNIDKKNFYKTQVILGKSKNRKLQYGVGNSIISNTSLKRKLLKWLEICKLYFS